MLLLLNYQNEIEFFKQLDSNGIHRSQKSWLDSLCSELDRCSLSFWFLSI
jgi:hypothetical protein